MATHTHKMIVGVLAVLFMITAGALAAPPTVIKTIPEHEDMNVDPGLKQIVIEFDQDMNTGGYSICGGGPKYPETVGQPKWTNSRIIVMPVKLKPNHEYELSINSVSFKNFRNTQGEPAVVYPIRFKTGTALANSSDTAQGETKQNLIVLMQEAVYAEQTEGDLDKAIGLYQQVIEQAGEVERLAARAAFNMAQCYLKKGDKQTAAEYLMDVVTKYAGQKALTVKAKQQLEEIGVSTTPKGNIFEMLGPEVCSYIGSKYGEVCAEAGMKQLYSNSHIYVVDNDFILRGGGMGYVYNLTGKPITERYRLTGTSYPDQKLYSISGDEMDIEIIADEHRSGFYQIYWNPKEPLEPGEFFNFGWAVDGSTPLPRAGAGGKYALTMKNNFGQRAYETFFLAVPQGTVLSDLSEEYTGKKTVNSWDIYWWKKEVQEDENHVVTLSLQKVPQFTQEMHNEIDPNGLIHFINPHNHTNNTSEPITTTSFINSDFVHVTGMYYKDGTPIHYTTVHKDNHFRYHITFDEPIMPGETVEGTVEGTITGLIKPVVEMPDTYQYYMNHSPNTNVPTLRKETYLLPEGAEVISTSPGMRKSERDGRIELSVEKIIPAGGSLLTTFQYRLTGAELASAKPLELKPAPWVDGEVMEVRLKRPAGGEYGTIIYSAQRGKIDDIPTWQIISHMYVTEGSISQYTLVEAEADSFVPFYGQTTNWMGAFKAEYDLNSVTLTVDAQDNETTRDIPVQTVVFDNEQALYLIRRMPLGENYEGRFPIFPVQGGVVVECRIKVLGIEAITVEAGTYTCYKTDLSIYAEGMRALQHTLWFSADEHKYLVQYDVGGTATMELAKVWQKNIDEPLIYHHENPHFTVNVPNDWRYYQYGTGPQFSLQLIAPEVKAWAVLVWQKRGTDPESESAMTIAKADFKELEGFFDKYTADEASWKAFTINGLEAAQYIATYQESGNALRKYAEPLKMVEYRTYIVDESHVYWFVFRTEKDQFEENKAQYDSITESFKQNMN